LPRYALTLAYDGTNFSGWQKQQPLAPGVGDRIPSTLAPELGEPSPGRVALRTVQAVVEQAVRYVVREPVMLQGASRTDSGVHARGQVAAFSCGGDPAIDAEGNAIEGASPGGVGWPLSRGIDTLLRAINGRLPEDVLVVGVRLAPKNFDPISDCTSKGYSYTLHIAPPLLKAADGKSSLGLRPVFDRNFVHHVYDPLDLPAMQRAAELIQGEHDFTAFAAAKHGRLTTVRTVYTCSVTDITIPGSWDAAHGATRLRIDISGSGFLYNMVRIIAGTLVEVGRGRINAEDIPAIIESLDRRRSGPTLPPTGLCLEWIEYKNLESDHS
jgi:tRNA pseudouridine38-40 synthase